MTFMTFINLVLIYWIVFTLCSGVYHYWRYRSYDKQNANGNIVEKYNYGFQVDLLSFALAVALFTIINWLF